MKTIGLALMILTLPVLLSLPPDPATITGHLERCPNCSGLESNPTRCNAAVEVSRGYYRRKLEAARRHPR
jgi:hypothetical protein